MRNKLTPAIIEQQLAILNKNKTINWCIAEGKLSTTIVFTNFVTAFAFISKVALIAERMNHHPELCNIYNRVSIYLITHDIGGISDLDFQLAHTINSIAT